MIPLGTKLGMGGFSERSHLELQNMKGGFIG